MRVLILKAYYYPEIASSSYLTMNIIDELIRQGHEVVVLAPKPTRGVSADVRRSYSKKNKIEISSNGRLSIHRFNIFPEYRNVFLRSLRYFMASLFYVCIGTSKKNVDIVFAGSTPPIMGLVSVIISKIKKVPFVYSLQDIFPDSLVYAGMTDVNSLLWKIGRVIENFIYKHADQIITISEDIKANIIEKSVANDKIEVVYNWVDEYSVTPIERSENSIFEKFNLCRTKFFVVYAGNIGYAQNIDIILDVANDLKEYDDIQFVIFGEGQQKRYYEERIINEKIINLLVFPLQPYSFVSNVYSLGNVSIVSCKKGFGGTGLPSKTWSILSVKRPVLASFDEGSELQRIIEKNNLGIFTPAEDTVALKNAILRLYNNQSLCDQMGNNGRQFILNNLTKEGGVKKYIDILLSKYMAFATSSQ